MVVILEMLAEGLICSDIAKMLNIQKPLVSYYVNKAKANNLVQERFRDTFKSYIVTQDGKNFIDQYRTGESLSTCRLENIQFKAKILQMPIIPVDWKRIEMHNWVQYSSQVDSVKVRLNAGNAPTLELLPSPINGDDPNDLIVSVTSDCMNTLHKLQDTIGLTVGRLQLSSRAEWTVYDPVAREFCKHNGQVAYKGLGKVNASKPRHIGEFEFHDPRAMLDYMLMPQRVKIIETLLQELVNGKNQIEQEKESI